MFPDAKYEIWKIAVKDVKKKSLKKNNNIYLISTGAVDHTMKDNYLLQI